MTLAWNEHPEAREELLDAHERYMAIEGRRLDVEFADEVEAAAVLILEWPDAAPPYGGRLRQPTIRTWHLGKFPYNLIYVVRAGEIFVLAYAHEARRPGYWSYRLEG